MHPSRFAPVLALLGAVACAPTVSSNVSRSSGRPMVSAKVLTMRELGSITSARDMYDVVLSLNPSLLRHRGGSVSVAMNGVLSGGIETLRYLGPGNGSGDPLD